MTRSRGVNGRFSNLEKVRAAASSQPTSQSKSRKQPRTHSFGWPGPTQRRVGRSGAVLLPPPGRSRVLGTNHNGLLDTTARLVYADWLDEHDDPYAWVFREPMPFTHGYHRFTWVGAMGRIQSGHFGWENQAHSPGLSTGRARTVPLTLCNRQDVRRISATCSVSHSSGPTGVSPTKTAKFPLPAATLTARELGFRLQGDLLIGPNQKPVCRIVNAPDTIAVLGELSGSDSARAIAGVIARLRRLNGAVELSELGRAEWTPPDGPENWPQLSQAVLNPFTNLGSDAILNRVLAEAQKQAERTHTPLSVLTLNVDDLRHFNAYSFPWATDSGPKSPV